MFGLALVGAFSVVGHLRPGVSAQDADAGRIAALETAVAGLTTRVAELEGGDEGIQIDALDAILTPHPRRRNLSRPRRQPLRRLPAPR